MGGWVEVMSCLEYQVGDKCPIMHFFTGGRCPGGQTSGNPTKHNILIIGKENYKSVSLYSTCSLSVGFDVLNLTLLILKLSGHKYTDLS